MRSASAAGVLALLACLTAGCGQDAEPVTSDETGAVALPEDLCALVPDSYTTDWTLSQGDHHTDNAEDTSTADCSMAGERAGAEVTFAATATTYGDDGDDTARDRAAAAFADACRDLAGQAEGALEHDDLHCSVITPGDDPATRGSIVDISRLTGVAGVLRVELTHHGEAWQSVAPDGVGIAGSILSAIGAG